MASEPIPSLNVDGIWHPPSSSRALPARLSVDASGSASVSADGGTAARASLSELVISPRVGAVERRLAFPDGSLFETFDNDAIDRLPVRGGRSGRLVAGLEQFRPRLAVFVAAVVVLCVLVYRFAVPVLVEVAVAVTPPVVPQLLSQGVVGSLDGTILGETKLPEDRQAVIRSGFAALAALTERGADGYTLNFRDGGLIGPNAFALPDGTIVVTDQLVDLAGNDEAVLGVLAHEIGHVVEEHSLRRIYRAAGITALVMMIAGDVGDPVEDILLQGAAIVSLSHSRDQETEADAFSVDLMSRSGRDPRALIAFLEVLRDRLGDPGTMDFLSTHPATPERIEAIRRLADEADRR